MATQEGLAAAAFALNQTICARSIDGVATHTCAASQEALVADLMRWTYGFESVGDAIPDAVNSAWSMDVAVSSRAEAITFDNS